MKFSILNASLLLTLISCNDQSMDLVVFPEYCNGCVVKNFNELKIRNWNEKFNIYFDTTDLFVVEEAKRNNLEYTHLSNDEIPRKYGDFANVVIVKLDGTSIELKTNEKITDGLHF